MRHALPLLALLLGAGAAAETPQDDPLLDALVQELDRNFAAWQDQPDPPYHLAARLVQQERVSLSARYGALQEDREETSRTLVVEARVGSPELDNTHPLRDRAWHWDESYSEQVPVDGPTEAVQTAL